MFNKLTILLRIVDPRVTRQNNGCVCHTFDITAPQSEVSLSRQELSLSEPPHGHNALFSPL
jgi:hypothetical protein